MIRKALIQSDSEVLKSEQLGHSASFLNAYIE